MFNRIVIIFLGAPSVVLNSGGKKKTTTRGIIYIKWWPPSFLPAAKGSARTPLGPNVAPLVARTSLGPKDKYQKQWPT
jgi:hypothetical protein